MSDLLQMYPWLDDAEERAVSEYMKSGGWLTEHIQTKEFERQLADFIGVKHCIAVPNGTLALVAAFWAVGVRVGDEVIVPDMTMIATANAAVLLGATPVFVDVEKEALTLDPSLVEKAITPKTKAVAFVSFNGRAGSLYKVKDICEAHNVVLVEDSAQSLGSYVGSDHLGTVGAVGTFSFSIHKIITTGQGGAVITNDDELGSLLSRLKDFGRSQGGADIHDMIGFNFKFTDVQAVIGQAQLKKVLERIAVKRRTHMQYKERLADVAAIQILDIDLAETTPWFMEVFVPDPDALSEYLAGIGIYARRMYPALHSQKAYGVPGSYPVSEWVAERGLWLPSAMQLTEADIDRVCEGVSAYYSV